ncbi:MAG: class IV adenylate cyclase [Acidobacteria bacterium]|nr:class IV adenylate cyclase [Acidobacteriota bacterium]
MAILNFEFKARAADIDALEQRLLYFNPRFGGEDRQIDTYFNVARGRLKLREGNIENALIHYERADKTGAKQSSILLYEHQPNADLKEMLKRSLGVKVVVDKRRRIYFIENVKFHFDRLDGLGTFVEVEAIDRDGSIGIETLERQCRKYAELFEIKHSDYVSESYSDLILTSKLND